MKPLSVMLMAMLSISVSYDGRSHGFASYFQSKQKAFVEVTEFAIKKTPSWAGNIDNPPLSARQAILRASQFKDTMVVDTKDEKWSLREAALRPFDHEKWYWLVSFELAPIGVLSSGDPFHLKLAVLMDGTVVKPEVVELRDDRK